jgi:nitrogenase molybdenum-iron protein NifN
MSLTADSMKGSKIVTINACKLCAPLGACLALRGVANAMPILHGSQGCATYIRRYIISHFKEPMDIASSGFSEASAIFGGERNLITAIENVTKQYQPQLIGIATTCLSETIGDDPKLIIQRYQKSLTDLRIPQLVTVATPSYKGTHVEGFQAMIGAIVDKLAQGGPFDKLVNILPGMISPADLRHLKTVLADFGLEYTMLPDYSETLDGPIWDEYYKIPRGGTPCKLIEKMGMARATIEFGCGQSSNTAGSILASKFKIHHYRISLPVGVNATDRLFNLLQNLSGRTIPESHLQERGRLIDSYVDGHKYLFGKKALLYGDEDLVVAMAGFLAEIGVIPVLCATGGISGHLSEYLTAVAPELQSQITAKEGADFMEIAELAESLKPDLLIGNSKGYSLARKLQVPLIRIGFPIHDRVGGQRILHLGYRGAQQLFDQITNALIESKQDRSPVGYSYM